MEGGANRRSSTAKRGSDQSAKGIGATACRSVRAGTAPLWQGLPVLVVVLLGGFTTNFLWTLYLNIRNKTGHQYVSPQLLIVRDADGHPADVPVAEKAAFLGPTSGVLTEASVQAARETVAVPLFSNYLLCACAGVTWYLQFFCRRLGPGLGRTRTRARRGPKTIPREPELRL